MVRFIGTVLSLSLVIDWFTQVVFKRSMGGGSALIYGLAAYWLWYLIATGGILC